jgi:hypothetical protein
MSNLLMANDPVLYITLLNTPMRHILKLADYNHEVPKVGEELGQQIVSRQVKKSQPPLYLSIPPYRPKQKPVSASTTSSGANSESKTLANNLEPKRPIRM